MSYVILSSKDFEYDFLNGWNSIQNSFNIMCTNKNLHFPKSLVKEAYKIILEECKRYHIDPTFYKFAEVTRMHGVVWQVDFYDNKECDGTCLSVFNIYFAGRSILQSEFGLG